MLKTLRASKYMGLRELAEKGKVPPGYLAELKSGNKNPSLDVLKRLARALGVAVGGLLE